MSVENPLELSAQEWANYFASPGGKAAEAAQQRGIDLYNQKSFMGTPLWAASVMMGGALAGGALSGAAGGAAAPAGSGVLAPNAAPGVGAILSGNAVPAGLGAGTLAPGAGVLAPAGASTSAAPAASGWQSLLHRFLGFGGGGGQESPGVDYSQYYQSQNDANAQRQQALRQQLLTQALANHFAQQGSMNGMGASAMQAGPNPFMAAYSRRS